MTVNELSCRKIMHMYYAYTRISEAKSCRLLHEHTAALCAQLQGAYDGDMAVELQAQLMAEGPKEVVVSAGSEGVFLTRGWAGISIWVKTGPRLCAA